MAVQTRLDECLSIREGRLFVEDCDANELARRFGTPIHVISEDQLRRNARRYRSEFEQRWTDGTVLVLASIKANFALATRWILSQEGLGCDCFGPGELHAALEGGVPPERISVNGSIKDAALIATAVRSGARITLDSAAELDLVRAYPVPRDPFGRGMSRLQERAEPAPDLSVYAEVVTGRLRRALRAHDFDPRGIRLEIEPGRGIYGNAGIHLASVRNIKVQRLPVPHRWIETDTSDMFLPDVVWEHNRWTAIVANKADQPGSLVADIVGLTCQPDRIIPQALVPDVAPGDTIAVLDTGAYQDGLACNFNALPRPGMVLVHGDQAEWITRPEAVADVFVRDLVPQRLRGPR